MTLSSIWHTHMTYIKLSSTLSSCTCIHGFQVLFPGMTLLQACYACCFGRAWRSKKIWPHHKPHARLPTLATHSATGDVQVMSNHKSLHGCAPDYPTELCNPVARSEPRRRLRSAAVGGLIIPRITSFGDHGRAFAHAEPHAWNSLPSFIRAAKTQYVVNRPCDSFFLYTAIYKLSFRIELNCQITLWRP